MSQIGGSFSKVVYRNNSIGGFMKMGLKLRHLRQMGQEE